MIEYEQCTSDACNTCTYTIYIWHIAIAKPLSASPKCMQTALFGRRRRRTAMHTQNDTQQIRVRAGELF